MSAQLARAAAWALLAILIGLVGRGGAWSPPPAPAGPNPRIRATWPAPAAADLLLSPNKTGYAQLYADIARLPVRPWSPVIGYGVSPVSDLHQPVLVVAAMDDKMANRVERPG